MRKAFIKITFLLVTFCFCQFKLTGQVPDDSIKTLKNTIRVNLTNPMLFGDKYTVVGYERVVGKHQTFSVNIGRFSLPKFISVNTDSLKLNKDYTEKGFTSSFDYRFYLKKENKYNAPRGVYIGPYYSFNMLQRTNTWDLSTTGYTGQIDTKMRLNVNLVGVQMGYQFVIKNRLAIDMILLGPGVWFYSLKTTTSTNLSDEDEELLFGKINEILAEKLPGKEIVLSPGDLSKNGTVSTSSAGFRYLIQIGWRF
jgi:hypothetical protein